MADRDRIERALARSLGEVESKTLTRLLRLLGMPPSLANVPAEFWADYALEINRVLTTSLQSSLLASLQSYIETHPAAPGWDDLVGDSARWSAEYITDLANEIARNAERLTGEIISDAQESGLSAADLAERLAARFGPVHAEMIAITELTRADAQATLVLQARLREMGLMGVRRWLTFEDERVCPLCGPFDHATEDADGMFRAEGMEIDGPPAHPRCRCQVVLERGTP